ncbi:MAG TPA: hypothetical protein VF519_05680 [Mycobacteriales bacterium]|jgi:hypothetical protein
MRRSLALGLAAAAVAAAFVPSSASAGDPVPDIGTPPIYTFCTLHFRQVPIFTDDVPVQPVVPYFAC